jgi:dynein light chain LC8-type
MSHTPTADDDGQAEVTEYNLFEGAKVLHPLEIEETILFDAIATAKESLKSDPKNVALNLKKKLDTTYGPHWHVFTGTSFGSHAVYEQNQFCYFYIGNVAVLCFKLGK